MPAPPQPAERTWAGAAHALAVRFNRRARLAAALKRLGWVLLGAAALAVVWRLLAPAGSAGNETVVVAAVLAAGLLGGLVPALRAAGRVVPVADADAAWALDRLGQAHGRGLAAAAVKGPAASEAAFADGGIEPPPAVRLLPPGGLLPILGAILLAAVALLAPAPATEPADRPVGAEDAPGTAAGGSQSPTNEALRAEAEARALEAEAAAGERVRAALNLPPEGPLDPDEVAKRLSDPERRKKAADAARPGTPLSQLLGDEKTSGEAVARLLKHGEDNRALASERRRAAAGARAGLERLPVPPDRRGTVERYVALSD